MMTLEYGTWFSVVTGNSDPHRWQVELANDPVCRNRLIRIPTGLGKTAGTVLAWIYNRVVRCDDTWPRRLVFCLPMRVLVEQTEAEIRKWLAACGVLWEGQSQHAGKVGVHVLMGGSDAGDWHLFPEECAVLIGTQDMLLSRALNRGYASPRARWPMEFGLLNSDALWIMDEVQLMDVGLATSAQLQQFREHDKAKALRPCHTWWMSATLQPDWLRSVDTASMVDALRTSPLAIHAAGRCEGILANPKPCELRNDIADAKAWAGMAWKMHVASTASGHGRITLVVANTVKTACALYAELAKLKSRNKDAMIDIRLVHSRFRSAERKVWRQAFLCREACVPDADRIIVATQVVEAGVDISATTLITELAPWPSLVQRFGRAGRYGGACRILALDRHLTEKTAPPYRANELAIAARALAFLPDVAPARLEAFEEQHPELLPDLYPYDPRHLLLRRELDELFDTTPDLTGADLDISRFIRSGDERDVLVFWRDVPEKTAPGNASTPGRNELCPVAVGAARIWLTEGSAKGRAWVWDYLDGAWRPCRRDDIYPGQTFLVAAAAGGYDPIRGWTGTATEQPVPLPPAAVPSPADAADAADECEALSHTAWRTIAAHGHDVANAADSLARRLALPDWTRLALTQAARWHDVGKAHPAFAACLKSGAGGHPGGSDIAKAPPEAWRPSGERYCLAGNDRRSGFRHELASVLALFGILERHNPWHDALLGPYRELLGTLGCALPQGSAPCQTANSAEHEILGLDGSAFDLLAYLVCAHHGKLRCAWHAAPADQDYRDRDGHGMPIRGVREGDPLPEIAFADSAGNACRLPGWSLHLEPARIGLSPRTGASWAERVGRLVDMHGPFVLAYLEALLRAADIRVSASDAPRVGAAQRSQAQSLFARSPGNGQADGGAR